MFLEPEQWKVAASCFKVWELQEFVGTHELRERVAGVRGQLSLWLLPLPVCQWL